LIVAADELARVARLRRRGGSGRCGRLLLLLRRLCARRRSAERVLRRGLRPLLRSRLLLRLARLLLLL
jgi:hypothetical protein